MDILLEHYIENYKFIYNSQCSNLETEQKGDLIEDIFFDYKIQGLFDEISLDLKKIIVKSNTTYFEKIALFKRFNMRINRNYLNEKLEDVIKTTNFSIQELSDKFMISEKTLKLRIRKIILESDISVSEKIKLFEKFSLRVSKNLRILTLKEILKSRKFTSKELAEKLKVSVSTIRNYLKEM